MVKVQVGSKDARGYLVKNIQHSAAYFIPGLVKAAIILNIIFVHLRPSSLLLTSALSKSQVHTSFQQYSLLLRARHHGDSGELLDHELRALISVPISAIKQPGEAAEKIIYLSAHFLYVKWG